MSENAMTRRQFNRLLVAGLLGGTAPGLGIASLPADRNIRVAAIQMAPKLADVQANMAQAEMLVREALRQGAQWIALPEMFTSAAAFHPDMLQAIQPLDGAPTSLLKTLARQGNAVIGGSFLASRNGDVYNSFVLVFPDGTVVRHDKDSPTYWETCYYTTGNDDGILQTPIGPVGSALCWEFIRSRTAQRLRGNVRLVIGGSCWWTLPDDADSDSPYRADNQAMMRDAAPRMARMLGVPVIHGAHVGRFEGFFDPDLPDVDYHSRYLGEAVIVAAGGEVLARRAAQQGAGIVVADIVVPGKPRVTEDIPHAFWTPEQMPQPWKEAWQRWFDRGNRYYQTVTRPFIETGIINEYQSEFF